MYHVLASYGESLIYDILVNYKPFHTFSNNHSGNYIEGQIFRENISNSPHSNNCYFALEGLIPVALPQTLWEQPFPRIFPVASVYFLFLSVKITVQHFLILNPNVNIKVTVQD